MRVVQNALFMRPDRVHSDGVDIINCRTESDGLGNCRCAGLEAQRCLGKGSFLNGHPVDHVTATKERRHLCEDISPPPQHTDPVRSIQLMR